jgi:hypothetical protein
LAGDNPIVGKWAVTSDDGHGAILTWALVVKEEGGKLAGSMSGDNGELQLLEPKLEGNIFTFKAYINNNCTLETKLKIEGNRFEGKFACPEVSGTMTGTKEQ